jgi:hypothetical protein
MFDGLGATMVFNEIRLVEAGGVIGCDSKGCVEVVGGCSKILPTLFLDQGLRATHADARSRRRMHELISDAVWLPLLGEENEADDLLG